MEHTVQDLSEAVLKSLRHDPEEGYVELPVRGITSGLDVQNVILRLQTEAMATLNCNLDIISIPMDAEDLAQLGRDLIHQRRKAPNLSNLVKLRIIMSEEDVFARKIMRNFQEKELESGAINLTSVLTEMKIEHIAAAVQRSARVLLGCDVKIMYLMNAEDGDIAGLYIERLSNDTR